MAKNFRDYGKDEVSHKLKETLKSLIAEDGFLLEIDASERSITHRLAIYLESLFSEWNVDCEYNRNYENNSIIPKKVLQCTKCDALGHLLLDQNGEPITNDFSVYPDIIVHERGAPNNLIAIEVKKTTRKSLNAFEIN